MNRYCILFALLVPLLGHGQIGVPVSAQADLYFPHVAAGGPANGQWQTRFTFVNPNFSYVNVKLRLYADGGGPLVINLGTGSTSQVAFTIPPNGTYVLTSQSGGPSTATGWAAAVASSSVLANVAFRFIQNGVAAGEITAEPTLPSMNYRSVATPQVGIAVSNVYANSFGVNVQVYDSFGNTLGQGTVTVPPMGHRSFNLYQIIPTLPSSFTGSLLITPQIAGRYFLAWVVYSDSSGIISSLPSGRTGSPAPHPDTIELAFARVVGAMQILVPTFGPTPQSVISSQNDNNAINAHASAGNTLQINLALAELISDSPSELAFIVGHELGHIYQQRTGGILLYRTDIEWDADYWGLLLSLVAGYDPYAGAGALGKLAMATGTANLGIQLWEDSQLASDAHGSFSTRISNLTTFIQVVCAYSTDITEMCNTYKNLIHPHFPGLPTTPLSLPDVYK